MNDLKEILKDTRQHLMTGVSYMIPFVVAGGILLALSVALYGQGAVPPEGTWLYDLFFIGVRGFQLMIPILAGFIAYSISERPGIAPAAIAAYVGNEMGAGFFGAIIAGLLGGIVVYYLKKIKVPAVFRSVMPIFIIPIVGTFITAGLMQWVIGAPIASLTDGLTAWLKGLQSGSIIILAIIMGLMDAFDMGGPVNKVAYAFTIMAVSQGLYKIAAINAVGVAVPPIGMGLATFLAKNKYTESEREAGKASILMGLVGITEGAIPFAAADPLKVIPSIMVGAAAGSALAAILGAENMVAWGGFIVLPAVTGKIQYIISILTGSVVTAIMVNLLKKPIEDKIDEKSDVSNIGEEIDLSFE
ncbi:PTS system fructose-like transporter subunit EIIC [Caloranaerobacter sp. TR13]|uniref:PTS fructose transporter subunit EIIC n=1 Tax=Caloranaerobacter sp. TR13 TaxID=1302151 RepID=UPI0006D46225|nr:PTS fructose transporter subunit EIIC [Caloranaerobacter sp. TR13]KPU27173.1 PTS system fructose-like transporter subunit EIIC [Caloranaerobacter sp. TR13]